jgi:hypothetical protein
MHMATFDLVPHLSMLIGQTQETFPDESNIRLLQFKMWLLFPDDYEIVDNAGRLLAAKLLRDIERAESSSVGPAMTGNRELSAKTLTTLLKKPEYKKMYNALFGTQSWTVLARSKSLSEIDELITRRRSEVETVCEMIDYRFRTIDHGTRTDKEANISRSEFYRWYEHPHGKLSHRTLRERWKHLRDSAPFLYASEKLGLAFVPQNVRSSTSFKAPINRRRLKKFIAHSLYVAHKIQSDIFDTWRLKDLRVDRKRLDSSPFLEVELAKMSEYKIKAAEMRMG